MFPIVRGEEYSMNDYQLRNLERITFNSRIMAGQACIRGMRIPVSLVVNLVANGKPFEEILSEYPDLELDDLKQSLQYAALLTRETVYPFLTTA